MKFFLLVGFGGCIGSIARAGLSLLLSGTGWATVTVNLVGAFVIGFFAKYAETFSDPSSVKAFWMIGICGGFTTFSAFGIELFQSLENGKWGLGVCYAAVNLFGTLLFIFAGFRVGAWSATG